MSRRRKVNRIVTPPMAITPAITTNDTEKGTTMFDPTKFGGDPSMIAVSKGKGVNKRNLSGYVMHNNNVDEDSIGSLKFRICPDDLNVMATAFGVDNLANLFVVPIPGEFALLMWPNDGSGRWPSRRVSHIKVEDGLHVSTGTLSIDGMRDSMRARFGRFKNVYTSMSFVEGGAAVKFSPTGERD